MVFEALGLSPDEERVYMLLLAEPNAESRLLAKRTHLSTDTAQRVITELELKALVARTSDQPPRFFPAPPGVALESLALRRRQEIGLALQQGASLAKRMYRDAIANPSDLIEMILGTEVLKQRVAYQLAQATHEVMVLSRPPYIQSDEEAQAQDFPEHVQRRYILSEEAINVSGHLEIIERDIQRGELTRFLPELPMKLVIVDRRVAYIAFDITDPEVSAGLVVHPSSLLDALMILFELLWEKAVPVTISEGRLEPENLMHLEAERIVTLLAAGLTDEAIARRLGISSRSLRRRIAKLQQELGAVTRFQAGIQAARKFRIET